VCASVVEKKYRMYDMFGEYDEIVDQRAFDEDPVPASRTSRTW
jgi:hypothetical protein